MFLTTKIVKSWFIYSLKATDLFGCCSLWQWMRVCKKHHSGLESCCFCWKIKTLELQLIPAPPLTLMMPAQLLTTAMTNCDTSVTTVLLSHSTSLVQFNSDDDNLQYYPGINSFIYRKVKKFQALMFHFRSEWGWKKTMIRKIFKKF